MTAILGERHYDRYTGVVTLQGFGYYESLCSYVSSVRTSACGCCSDGCCSGVAVKRGSTLVHISNVGTEHTCTSVLDYWMFFHLAYCPFHP